MLVLVDLLACRTNDGINRTFNDDRFYHYSFLLHP